MMNKPLLLGICMLLLIPTAMAQTIDVTEEPLPTIQAEYNEDVEITDAELSDGGSYTLIQRPQGTASLFNFTPDEILRNGNYTFTITASDPVQNEKTANYSFEVNVAFIILLIEPNFGWSPDTPYDIVIETTEQAYCSWSYVQAGSTEGGNYFDNEDPSAESNPYNYMHTLSGASFDNEKIWFKCRNINGEEVKQSYTFNVDVTPPQIGAAAEPDPVTDPSKRNTTLTVTTDDYSVCWLNGTSMGGDPSLESTYRQEHTHVLTYDIFDTDTHEYTYDVRCMNLAGLDDSIETSVTVQLTRDFVIERISPDDYTNAASVTMAVETPIAASCDYRQNGSYSGMSTTDNHEHATSFGELEEGIHKYEVRCSAASRQYLNITFTVDRTPPRNVTITTGSESCNLEQLSAEFSGQDDIGIHYYNYTIEKGGETLVPWTATGGTEVTMGSLDLETGQTYTWKMTAVDAAGNRRSASPKSVTPLNSSAVECDTKPPFLTVTSEDVDGGEDLTVVCQDDETACQSSYSYSIINDDGTCTSPDNQLPMTQSLLVTYGKKACFWVSDLNGNEATQEVIVTSSGGPVTPGSCGNGEIDPGEQCDGSDLAGNTCSDLGFTGGSLSCSGCELDVSACTGGTTGECGDGTIDAGEQCEGNSVSGKSCSDYGFTGGSLSCDSSCLIDTNGCTDQPIEGFCGDGEVQPGEDCDGSVPNSISCTSLGFDGGSLSCNNCELVSDDCTGGATGFCGDGTINTGESCDGSNFGGLTCEDYGQAGGELTCESCQVNTILCEDDSGSYCGDGVVDRGEDCDGDNFGDLTCNTLGFAGGSLSCSDTCDLITNSCTSESGYCGDGEINVGESCDGDNFGDLTCAEYGQSGGDLLCEDCEVKTIMCESPTGSYCGDGTVDKGEDCDGNDFGDLTCTGLGFTGGSLTCSDTCDLETTSCTGTTGGSCGDGEVNEGEECDGSAPSGVSCSDFGYTGGSLSCEDCEITTNSCTDTSEYCGDGVIDRGESCDGTEFDGATCEAFGFEGGSLSCNECGIDTSGCTGGASTGGSCGDGTVDSGEECDGAVPSDLSCTDFNYDAGSLSCEECEIETYACTAETGSFCGDGVIDRGESCDSGEFDGATCPALGFDGGSLSCIGCAVDTSGCTGGASSGGVCGDGTINQGEMCDGTNLGSLSCQDLEFTGGSLSCDDCRLDTDSCTVNEDTIPPQTGPGDEEPPEDCGNGVIDAGEDCDGSNLDGASYCEDIGLTGGTLSCTRQCRYDTSNCDAGDGDFTPEEEGSNLLAMILVILGLVMMLGGGGYLGWKQYYGPGVAVVPPDREDTPQQDVSPTQPVQKPKPKGPSLDDVREMEKRKMLKEKREKKKEKDRKDLFKEFEVKSEKDADTKKVKDDIDEVFGD